MPKISEAEARALLSRPLLRQALRQSNNRHEKSHEHLGDRRMNGPASWNVWRYDEVMAYFCARTNITFLPIPSCPSSGHFCEAIMDCASLSTLLGHHCYPMTDDGSIVYIETSARFEDGDDVPAYAELSSDHLRFFDDGDVYDHFAGLGIDMENDANKQFVSDIAEAHGLRRNALWEVEIMAEPQQAVPAFAQYMAAMAAFVEWEKERDAALEALYRADRGRAA